MQEQYRPDLLEPEVQKFWQDNKTFKAVQDNNKEKYYCLSCSLIRQAVCIWGMCVITPSAMWFPAINV